MAAAPPTAAGRPAGVPEAEDSDSDSDSNLETEGASGQDLQGWSHLWGLLWQKWEGQAGIKWAGALVQQSRGAQPSVGHLQHSRWRQLPVPSLQCSWGIRSSTIRTRCRVKGWAVTEDRGTLGRWLAVPEEGSTFFSLSPTRHPWAQRTGQGHPLPEVLPGPRCRARFLLSAPRESPRPESAAPWPRAPGTPGGTLGPDL